MSALPQRKKSAEEIAKLREEMGLPPTTPTPSAEKAPEESLPREKIPAETGLEEEPIMPRSAAKAVRSLKKSERILSSEASRPSVSRDDSKLPKRRRTEKELQEMRRREAMQATEGVPPAVLHLKQLTAHPVILTLGYLLAIGGGVGGLLVAAYIAVKKPRSRHHAGFMTAIAVLVLVALALHYFPNLNPVHGS